MRGDREDRQMAAMAVEQTIDEVEIAWPATAGAHREIATRGGLAAGREGRHFFMPYVHPIDPAKPAKAVDEAVEAIASDAPDPLHPGIRECDGHQIRDGTVGHSSILSAPGEGAPWCVTA